MVNKIKQMSVSDIPAISDDSRRNALIKQDVGIIKSINVLYASDYPKIDAFRATDYQIGVIKRGYIELECNLQNIMLNSGDILLFSPGTLICTKRKSSDYDAAIISLNANAVDDAIKPFEYVILKQIKHDISALYFSLITSLMIGTVGNTSTIMAVQSFIAYLLEQHREETMQQQKCDRRSQIFNSFVSLVNINGRNHHRSKYYADKLCISLNYLNDIVKEISGRSVFNWINEYLISEAKVMLLNSSDTVLQISDYLNFPNSAFFCRFFKQHTGFTPSQFRKSV